MHGLGVCYEVCLKVHAVEGVIIFTSQNTNTTKEQHSSHQGHEGPMVTARHIVFLWQETRDIPTDQLFYTQVGRKPQQSRQKEATSGPYQDQTTAVSHKQNISLKWCQQRET